MDPTQFLTWLATSGGAAVALAFVTERLSAFQKLTPQNKQLVHFIGPIAISLVAYAVLTYVPPEVLAQIAPWFQIVYVAAGSWIAGQIGHKADPAA